MCQQWSMSNVAEGVLLAQDQDHSVLKSSPVSLAWQFRPRPQEAAAPAHRPVSAGDSRARAPHVPSQAIAPGSVRGYYCNCIVPTPLHHYHFRSHFLRSTLVQRTRT